MPSEQLQVVRQLAQLAAEAGGRAYYVGGYVRDRLLGLNNKDIDIEVHGLYPEQLERILNTLGECNAIGRNFGIYMLKHYGIDIAMPRSEIATGRGHRDFQVYVDPFLGMEKASARRDFTINAMAEDILTGEILDYYGGRHDLSSGILRHVNSSSFTEDPLRVLRAAQFAARFGFTVAAETVSLCSGMDLQALPCERIMEELKKALLKASHPSVFFTVLRTMKQLDFWFPEVMALTGIRQDAVFHPEGDVWNHTMLVLDAAATLRPLAQEPLAFMLSALAHDFGKVSTTEQVGEHIRAIGHEAAGVPLAESFVRRLSGDRRLCRYVANMTELHMRPNLMEGQKAGQKAFSRLFDLSVCPQDLLLLSKADRLGQAISLDYSQTEAFLKQRLQEYERIMALPYVTGADLTASGLYPGPYFSKALAFAHKLRLSGVPKQQALQQTLGYVRSELKDQIPHP